MSICTSNMLLKCLKCIHQIIPKLLYTFKVALVAAFEMFVNILIFCYFDVLSLIGSLIVTFWNLKIGQAILLLLMMPLVFVFFKAKRPLFGFAISFLLTGVILRVILYHKMLNEDCTQLNFGQHMLSDENLAFSKLSHQTCIVLLKDW